MSKDKRLVSTDALETLGTIIGDQEKRDAIHLAVEPAVAAHQLRPGDDVGFVEGGVGSCDNPVGIVDPFLKGLVRKGQRFWLVVYPRQITSLRHVWTHPSFPEEVSGGISPLSSSEKWLRDYAASIPEHYDTLMEHAKYWVESEGTDYWCEGGRFEGMSVPDEFRLHYETVTGTPVAPEVRGSFFTCSC